MPYSTALSGGLTENSERIRGKDRRGGIYRAGCDDTAETCGVQTEDTELREQDIITREIHRLDQQHDRYCQDSTGEENESGDKKENLLEENFCCIPRISLFVVSSRMHRSGNRNGQGG